MVSSPSVPRPSRNPPRLCVHLTFQLSDPKCFQMSSNCYPQPQTPSSNSQATHRTDRSTDDKRAPHPHRDAHLEDITEERDREKDKDRERERQTKPGKKAKVSLSSGLKQNVHQFFKLCFLLLVFRSIYLFFSPHFSDFFSSSTCALQTQNNESLHYNPHKPRHNVHDVNKLHELITSFGLFGEF